jgi:hypothetical protein
MLLPHLIFHLGSRLHYLIASDRPGTTPDSLQRRGSVNSIYYNKKLPWATAKANYNEIYVHLARYKLVSSDQEVTAGK